MGPPLREQIRNDAAIPLCADLDGTTLATDALLECLCAASRANPVAAFAALRHLVGGPARLKESLFLACAIDVERLPYRKDVLQFLHEQRAIGRRLVLVTGAWQPLAERIAGHLGLFDEVIGTTRGRNLKGDVKARALVERFGERGFDYIGDSMPDRHVWQRCREAYVVERGTRLSRSLQRDHGIMVRRVFDDRPARGRAEAMWRSLRPQQWVKNLLVFVPLITAHVSGGPQLVAAGIAFIAFCLVASGAYLANDLLDLSSDRAHPRKRLRPLPLGELPISWALPAALLLVVAGLAVASSLELWAFISLSAYVVLSMAYSALLKKHAIVDVIALAALYSLRLIVGGWAAGAPTSAWLLAFSMFAFFSLALLKRHAELMALPPEHHGYSPGRGYAKADLGFLLLLGLSSALVSVLVLALYTNSDIVNRYYGHPWVLWLLCPLFLYWLSRAWLVSSRGGMIDDPIAFAIRDPVSYGVLLIGVVVFIVAS